MTAQPPEPRSQKFARYEREMRGHGWKEARYTNKGYFQKLIAKLDALEKNTGRATIGDLQALMKLEGNEDYFKAFEQYLDVHKIEKPFPELDSFLHEFVHFFLEIGHTPEHEQFLFAATCASEQPIRQRRFVNNEEYKREIKKDLEDGFEYGVSNDSQYYKEGIAHRLPKLSARDISVYYACGLYLDMKYNAIAEQPCFETDDYNAKKEFALAYANPEQDKLTVERMMGRGKFSNKFVKNFNQMPYQYAILTPQERSVIIAVATGLREPEQTPYPRRMTAIKEELIEAGVFYDMKPWAQEMKEKMGGEETNIDSDQYRGPKFDQQQHDTARAKLLAARAKRVSSEPGMTF